MTSEEFAELMAYTALEPWGDDWLIGAMQASVNYNIQRDKKSKSLSPDDFVPRKKERQTPEQMKAVLDLVMKTTKQIHGRRKN